MGHNKFAPVNSLAIICNQRSAFNCYWRMPFRKHARVTLTNEDKDELGLLTYQITYALTEVPENAGYFHAQWRRAVTDRANPDYVIADGIKGRGKYAGTLEHGSAVHVMLMGDKHRVVPYTVAAWF